MHSASKYLSDNASPELLQRFKAEFTDADWQTIEGYLSDERRLGQRKKKLVEKLDILRKKLEKESEVNISDKCKMVGQMQECLYDIQLVEHALKVFLNCRF